MCALLEHIHVVNDSFDSVVTMFVRERGERGETKGKKNRPQANYYVQLGCANAMLDNLLHKPPQKPQSRFSYLLLRYITPVSPFPKKCQNQNGTVC